MVIGSGGAGKIGRPPVATVWMHDAGALLKTTLWTWCPRVGELDGLAGEDVDLGVAVRGVGEYEVGGND